MSITMNLYYTGTDGNAKKFVEEMENSGTANAIRTEAGNEKYDYFFSAKDPETVLLIDSWRDQEAIDVHHASPMMGTIAALREKYNLTMRAERYLSDEAGVPQKDQAFIRTGDAASTPTTEPTEQKPRAHALVVDDMKVNQKIMASMLEPLGISSDFAESGGDCLNLCKENHYDLIFLDQQMPGVYGTEIMVYLKKYMSESKTSIPVVCYTSNDTPEDRKDYQRAGFAAILGKPAHPDRVREIVEELLGEKFDIS